MMHGISVIWKLSPAVLRSSAPQLYFSMRTTPPELRTRKPLADRDSTWAWLNSLLTYHILSRVLSWHGLCKAKNWMRAGLKERVSERRNDSARLGLKLLNM